MPLNIPTYDTDNISFGPGVLYLGPAGSTPTADVGAIAEDGITITPENQTRDIFQGNPKLPIKRFSQQQGVVVEVTGIEWNFNNLAYGLGAANTTVDSGEDTLAFGGSPLPDEVAIKIEHSMAIPGHTLEAYVWKAVTNGAPTMPLTHDEHAFPLSFAALRATTNWAGVALATDEQLMLIRRVK